MLNHVDLYLENKPYASKFVTLELKTLTLRAYLMSYLLGALRYERSFRGANN